MSLGAYQGESGAQAGERRIVLDSTADCFTAALPRILGAFVRTEVTGEQLPGQGVQMVGVDRYSPNAQPVWIEEFGPIGREADHRDSDVRLDSRISAANT